MSSRINILIIDDEQDFCELMIRMLQREPHHVACAHNLNQAAYYLKKETPDVILLDYNLPDGNGLEFIRKSKADFEGAKIILMTADPSPERKQQAREAGILFLEKPFGIRKIREAIAG
jgi:DNA-binding response OmpR family regulator